MPDTAKQPMTVRGTEILAGDSHQQYRQKLARIALDEMYQFVAVLDAQGTLLEVNRAALEGGGLKLSDVEGKPFWKCFWWGVSQEIQDTLQAAIERCAQGEFIRYDVEVYGRAGGKETIIIDFSMIPVKDATGKVVFIVPEGRDITEKKAQEREIAQKNLELQGLLERIRELDEIKTQFFANVSHELRTPLALILGPAQRLIDDEGAMPLAERREGAQVVVRNARMLLKHVNDLLDMSKLEAGKLKIELQDADVAGQVRFLASHFAVLAAERKVEYWVDANEACVAAVDPDKLQRVVMNLLGNAFKFAPAGGRVHCSLRQSRGELTVAVEDSGPGVKPEQRQAIFERFRQGDGGINRKVGGTGLGLAIAKEFVEMHKGRIEVLDSALGGARFQVTIPLHRLGQAGGTTEASVDRTMLDGVIEELRFAGQERPAKEDAGSPALAGKARVLVVEDNPDMNRFITQCLGRHYEVASAFDGREGLEKALQLRPTLVVSDIMMPNVSGVEMIAQMRRLPELRSTPVLLLSAKADEDLMVKLLDEGAQDFIVKPFSEKDLLVRVRNLVAALQARAETELQKQLLHSLFMQAPTAIAVLRGPRHVVELANPPICMLWGRAEKAVLDRPLLDALPELREQIFPSLLEEVYRTGVAHVGKETPARLQRDGAIETGYFNFVYSPFRNIDGEVDGIFVIASDVTAQVVAREQVDGLRAAAEGANRAKDEFLAMLGHELRNPLSPIVTALQLMKLQGPENTERARDVIERQVGHLTRLVDDLLDVSRIARGKVELRIETVEMAEVVAKAIEMASPLLEKRAHTLVVDVPRHGLPVEADPMRLSQVISNLLTNAAKYTPPGGRITVRGERAGAEVVLSVRDTGMGIAADVLPRVFDLFVQERQAIDRSHGGLGLGLTIVRNLIERHGGSVSVHSEGTGRGSEFIVRLPGAALGHGVVGLPRSAAATATAVLRPEAPRILVVDDNEDGATMLTQALRHKGYQARVAHDGSSALRVAAEFLPDIALLDIGLPVMDGYELASHLRGIPGLAGLRLIAVTGYGQESDRRRSREAGFDHHIVKPVGLQELEAIMAAPRAASGRAANS
jgi:PAS domain S-box-containing protein